MKTFEYKGYDESGKAVRGLVEALDLRAARGKLAERGILAENIHAAGSRRGGGVGGAKFRSSDKDVFYNEIATLLDAGLPLTGALDVLIESPETEKLSRFLASLRDRIKEGGSFSKALEDSEAEVTAFELAAIDAGEQSGALAAVCARLGAFYSRRHHIVESFRTAMVYPLVVLSVCFIIAVGLLGFMMTRFEQIWTEAGIELPALTRIVLAAGKYGVYAVPLIVLLGLLAIFQFKHAMKQSEWKRIAWNRNLFRLPLFKGIYTALVNLRFSGTLGLLLDGGVQLADALSIAGRATGNAWLHRQVEEKCRQVQHGGTLSDAVRQIPPLAGSLPGWIKAGEESGAMVKMLEKASDRFELKFEQSLQRTLRLFEPMILLVVGAIVFVIALSILLPVLSVNQGIA